ncbi:CLUMA_CG016796, isoform A [Clunio marinus]|uniref:CLUMA_CG016796, isoform A n=1 Tax=Clunio marinus TaxID=568069 RepID=A0A1J1IV16_9DIPT|nr:CLUMA_CG016796, isoform A [Clunio marinus]
MSNESFFHVLCFLFQLVSRGHFIHDDDDDDGQLTSSHKANSFRPVTKDEFYYNCYYTLKPFTFKPKNTSYRFENSCKTDFNQELLFLLISHGEGGKNMTIESRKARVTTTNEQLRIKYRSSCPK